MMVFKQITISDEEKARLVQLRIDEFDDAVNVLAEDLRSGKITLGFWEEEMRTLLRLLLIGAAAIGAGGWESVTQRDWGRTGAILKEQYNYLHNFAQDISEMRKTITALAIAWRARLYGKKASLVAETTQAGDLRFSLPWLPGDGSTTCMNNCRCFWSLTAVPNKLGGKDVSARWTLTEAEHCEASPGKDGCVDRDGVVVQFSVPPGTRVPSRIGSMLGPSVPAHVGARRAIPFGH